MLFKIFKYFIVFLVINGIGLGLGLLYFCLRTTKPEYGYTRRIQVKEQDGQLVITNAHVGSLGDILTYVIEDAPELNMSISIVYLPTLQLSVWFHQFSARQSLR